MMLATEMFTPERIAVFLAGFIGGWFSWVAVAALVDWHKSKYHH